MDLISILKGTKIGVQRHQRCKEH